MEHMRGEPAWVERAVSSFLTTGVSALKSGQENQWAASRGYGGEGRGVLWSIVIQAMSWINSTSTPSSPIYAT